ncbi:MAG: hypothetical protein JWM04_1638 [Verrucomicrobiales bacterium]|nr:hypothetical protein [Verrucomicrobiales bacterium]
MGPRKRKWLLAGVIFLSLLLLIVLGSNVFILESTSDLLLHDTAQVPPTKYALVLGTTPKFRRTGNRNPTFDSRMVSAAKLYRDGKAGKLILSGGANILGYNEPESMRQTLVKLGVPAEAMVLDPSGLRTFDSIWRTKNLFHQNKITIVTDDKHLPRALFLGKALGMDAVGFSLNATSLPFSLKYVVRESGARVKAILDVYLLHTQPADTIPPAGIPETSLPLPAAA